MDNRIKDAFDAIESSDELKQKTKAYLFNYQKPKRHFRLYYLIPSLIVVIGLITFGYWVYFVPVVAISVDINPSIELGINRFNQVVTLSSYNNDGQELLQSLDLKYQNYQVAIDEILSNELVVQYLEEDEVMTICVISDESNQTKQIVSDVNDQIETHQNTYCYHANHHEVSKAHDLNLSYGKYHAYLQLQELDSSITLEQVQQMTMKEIHHLIESLSQKTNDNSENSSDCQNQEQHGHHHGHD